VFAEKECTTNYQKHRVSIVPRLDRYRPEFQRRSMVTVGASLAKGKENDHYVDLVSWISGTHPTAIPEENMCKPINKCFVFLPENLRSG
jgi:hypothetical protein